MMYIYCRLFVLVLETTINRHRTVWAIMVETILVTGATGTVSSEVVKQLSFSGQNVKAAVHTKSKADKFNYDKRIDIVSIDYNKPESIANAFRDVDNAFLLTPPSPDNEYLFHFDRRG